jgi:hypothetical protein
MNARNICLLTIVLGVISTVAFCQTSEPETPTRILASQPLERFDLVNGSLRDGLAKLAREVGGHFGYEEVLREKYTDPQDLGPKFSLHLTDTTVGAVLDTLCQHDSRYTWAAERWTINVYPEDSKRDNKYLLNRRISHLELKDSPNPDRAVFALDTLPLPKEQIGYVEAGGDNAYDAPWTASFNDLDVRQFVNELAIHMGPSTIWSFQGSTEERLFSFARFRHQL